MNNHIKTIITLSILLTMCVAIFYVPAFGILLYKIIFAILGLGLVVAIYGITYVAFDSLNEDGSPGSH